MFQNLQGGFWLGVDISKATMDACVAPVGARPADWAKLKGQRFNMDTQGIAALALWLRPALRAGKCLGVCVESTGAYSHRFVHAIAHLELPEVTIVNPAYPLAFRKSLGLRDKCDRVDAAVLALYGVVHEPKPNKRDEKFEHMRALWRLYEDCTEELLRWRNRLEQCLDSCVKKVITKTIARIKRDHEKVWSTIEEEIANDKNLRYDAALLCSIPGVAKKTVALVFAELGDLRTWRRSQIVGYAGLFPRMYSSGKNTNLKPRLAKGGGARIRKGLYMPALGQLRTKSRLALWAKQLIARGLAKMAAIGAMMRKQLLLMRAVLISGKPYQHTLIAP